MEQVAAVRSRVWLAHGLAFGFAFGALGLAFVLLSTLTGIERPVWLVLNQVKGIVGFGLCGLGGFLVARRTGSIGMAARTGLVAGAVGGLLVPLCMYAVAFGLLPHLEQYPFEHHDFVRSGASTVQEFLLSAQGRAEVTSTTVDLAPLVAVIGAALGAAAGAVGGVIAQRFPSAVLAA